MKKLNYLILFSLILQFSCETTDNSVEKSMEIDTVKPLSNTFLARSNDNKIITSEEVIAQIKNDADIPKNVELVDFSLRKLDETEKAEEDSGLDFYVLQARTEDGKTSVAHLFRADELNSSLMSEGRTCKCTSTNCTTGCDARLNGTFCSCSYCSSECKKESTVTEEIDP
jgi:hypothetical protein